MLLKRLSSMRQSILSGVLQPLAAILFILSATLFAKAETLHLKDGSVLQGEVTRTGDSLLVRHAILGDLVLRVSDLAESSATVEHARVDSNRVTQLPEPVVYPSDSKPREKQDRDPTDQALFFLPTGFMPPKGSFTFRDFELLFLTGSYSPTATTSLTGGFLFPISPELQLLTVGLKQQLFSMADPQLALAITGTFAKPLNEFLDNQTFVNSNLVFSWRQAVPGAGLTDAVGAHVALGYLGIVDGDDSGWDNQFSLGLGAEGRFTAHAKFIIEYLNAAPFTDESDFDGGLLTLGIRLHGSRLSADIAGMRPLTDKSGDLIFLPLLIITYRF